MVDKIIPLKGPDRVRLRPAVMFGDIGEKGALKAVTMLLDLFFAEAYAGCNPRVSITLKKDDSILVESADGGMVLSEEQEENGNPAWHNLFCSLYYTPRSLREGDYQALTRMQGWIFGREVTPDSAYEKDCFIPTYLACVQYASSFMKVRSQRDGEIRRLSFEKGYSVSILEKEAADGASGTTVHFQPDPQVFGEIRFSRYDLMRFLEDAAVTAPGLTVSLKDERDGTCQNFSYPGGTYQLAEEKHPDALLPFFKGKMEAEGKDRYNLPHHKASVSLVLSFGREGTATCYHNGKLLSCGGTHLEAIYKKAKKHIEFHCRLRRLSLKKLKERLILVVETRATAGATSWENGAQNSIQNVMIAHMAEDILNETFGTYVIENEDALRRLLK
ncbi:MAG: hypothetical protein IKJ74_04785 [Clostridia bacterium]|nr:hypothetical protein [Clostridia bacterium]